MTVGYAKPRAVFTDFLEKKLVEHIIRLYELYYGLTPKEIRKLAYRFAVANNRTVPDNWHENETASQFWFTKFMQR